MMKDKKALKKLLTLKLQTIDCLLGMLPREAHLGVKELQQSFISVIHEVTAEYLQKEEGEKKDNGLKAVVIE